MAFRSRAVGFGESRDLLYRDGTLTQLKLDGVTQLDSGIVVLSYQVR